MKIKQAVLAAIATTGLVFAGAINAQEYQWEVGFENFTSEGDVSGNEITPTAIGGTYNFARVATANGPLAEAAFLSRASNVSAFIDTIDANFGGISDSGDGYIMGVHYQVPESNYYVGLDLDSQSLDSGWDRDDTMLTGGMYIDDRSAVEVVYATGSEATLDTSTFGVNYKNLLSMNGANINLEAGFSSVEVGTASNTDLSVAADYYFSSTWSAGAGLTTNSGDDPTSEGSTISLAVDYFFTPTVGATLAYDMFSVSDSLLGEDETTLTIALAARF